ncbi:MAG: DUF1858 domain-containing protein [Bacteroidota bacterium]|nr:DUF1858 domain-containing protein [Bacteroidota bacterium]
MIISKTSSIEELVDDYSFAVKYLSEKGIRCIVCGEPIWGTLEEACEEKGFSDEEIDEFVTEMNQLAKAPKEKENENENIPSINTKKIN